MSDTIKIFKEKLFQLEKMSEKYGVISNDVGVNYTLQERNELQKERLALKDSIVKLYTNMVDG